jgi:hypothetical protein
MQMTWLLQTYSLHVLTKSMMAYLEVRTGHASCNLPEEWIHDALELSWLYHVQDLLNLSQEHHLLLTARLGPELQETLHHLKHHKTMCE